MESQETKKLIDELESVGVEIRILRSLVDPSVFHCILMREHIRGFGTDTKSSLAILKAYAEFNERQEYHLQVENGLASTSNGFAAHINFELASRSAINELIERDTFLTSWATRQSPYWLSDAEVLSLGGEEALGFITNFAKSGFKFQYGICGVNSGISVIIGCLSIPEDDSFGFAIDTSASDKFLVSARKVYYSNCYLGSIVLNRRKRVGEIACDLAEINAVEANFEFYLRGENKPSWFFESSKEISLFPAFEVRVERLRETATPSLVVVRASSTDCQHYFAGVPTAESLNMARITSIFPNKEVFFDLHPLA